MITLRPEQLFAKTSNAVTSGVEAALTHPADLEKVPGWMLGGLLGMGAGVVTDKDDRFGGALKGGVVGAGIGMGVDMLPDALSRALPHVAPKVAFVTPSLSLPGGLGLKAQRGDRLPGTSLYVDPGVVERAGRALDQGAGVENAIRAGARGSQTNYLPIAGAVLGGLAGHHFVGGPGATTIGALLGGAGGLYGQQRTHDDSEERARDAVKGLLIERARLGDAEAHKLLQTHYSEHP